MTATFFQKYRFFPLSPARSLSPTFPLQFPPSDEQPFAFQKGRAFEDIPLAPIRHTPYHKSSWDHTPPEPCQHEKLRQIINSTAPSVRYPSVYAPPTSSITGYDYSVQPDGSVPIRIGYDVQHQLFEGYPLYSAQSTPSITIGKGTMIICHEGWGAGADEDACERIAICCVKRGAGVAYVKFGIRRVGEEKFAKYVMIQFEAADVELEPESRMRRLVNKFKSRFPFPRSFCWKTFLHIASDIIFPDPCCWTTYLPTYISPAMNHVFEIYYLHRKPDKF